MKVIFFGGGKFAMTALESLREHFDVKLVITNPEKPVGRKQIFIPSAVEVKAKELNLPIRIIEKFDAEVINDLKQIDPEMMVVVDYGKIIPQKVIDIAKKGTINVHPSKLPQYRGASPIQSAIFNGETQTAISIMLIDQEMDHGPILLQQTVEIKQNDTFGSLYSRLAQLYPQLLVKAMQGYLNDKIKPQEQDHSAATFTKLLKKTDGQIDWTQPAEAILNMIRAFDPWPGTFTTWNNRSLKIISAKASEKVLRPGLIEINEQRLFIGTGTKALEILEIQPSGKQKMTAAAFANGNQTINDVNLSTGSLASQS